MIDSRFDRGRSSIDPDWYTKLMYLDETVRSARREGRRMRLEQDHLSYR